MIVFYKVNWTYEVDGKDNKFRFRMGVYFRVIMKVYDFVIFIYWLCIRVCMCLLLHYMPYFTGTRRFSITLVTSYRNSFENYLSYVEIGELGQIEAAYNCLYTGLRL